MKEISLLKAIHLEKKVAVPKGYPQEYVLVPQLIRCGLLHTSIIDDHFVDSRFISYLARAYVVRVFLKQKGVTLDRKLTREEIVIGIVSRLSLERIRDASCKMNPDTKQLELDEGKLRLAKEGAFQQMVNAALIDMLSWTNVFVPEMSVPRKGSIFFK